ncbi:WD40 repeat-like protein [Amylocystis lapponica]|nr:WD40 repeat-like protein [Amylocystis lapponica]
MQQTTDKANFLRAEAELVLELARKEKAVKTKDLGSPIELPGKPLAIQIRGNAAFIAESTAVVRQVDLETGKSRNTFRGHSAPVTCLAFFDKELGSAAQDVMVSGSWDKTIKVWDVERRTLILSTPAHSDFVKALLVIPSLRLLVSGSSDKIVRFWDLSTYQDGKALTSVGSISAHTRPVESFAVGPASETSAILYTADTMGILKVWELTKEAGEPLRWRSTLLEELTHHRTRINETIYGNGQLWTASSDETVQLIPHAPPASNADPPKAIPPLTHPVAVRAILPLALTPLGEPYLLTGAGDVIRTYDVSEPDAPELLGSVDAHWHDVTALRLWMRRTPVAGVRGQVRVEPWVVSASLDGTLRKWRLSELLHPPALAEQTPELVKADPEPSEKPVESSGLSEEEERELAELMDSD